MADPNAASAPWAFGIRAVAVAGWTVGTDAAWGNVDRGSPNISAGPETGSPDPEQYLAMKPDLFVTIVGGDQTTPYTWTFVEEGSYERLGSIAPVIGISGSGSAAANADRFAELAALLGADLQTPELVAAKTAFDETVAAFTALATEKADLTSLFAGWTAPPPAWPIRRSGPTWRCTRRSG